MKLKYSELAGKRLKLLQEQDNRCAICKCSFDEAYYNHKKRKTFPKHTPCLDHCHRTGQVRGVLCSGCNSTEGVFINAITRYHTNLNPQFVLDLTDYLNGLTKYYVKYHLVEECITHPSFKNDEEKRLLKNKRARLKRKKR